MALMEWTPAAVKQIEECWSMPSEIILRKTYADILKGLEPKEVLEVGCGTGLVYRALLKNGLTPEAYIGLDISPTMLTKCKEYTPKANVILGTAESLPFADNSFDIVSSFEVFCHLEKFDKPLKEMLRVAKRKIVFSIDLSPTETTIRSVEIVYGSEKEEIYPRVYWSFNDIIVTIGEIFKNQFYRTEIRTLNENKWLYIIDKSQKMEHLNLSIRPYFGYTSLVIGQYDGMVVHLKKVLDEMQKLTNVVMPYTTV